MQIHQNFPDAEQQQKSILVFAKCKIFCVSIRELVFLYSDDVWRGGSLCNFVTYFHASVRDIRGYMFLSDIRGGGGKVS